MNIFIPRRLNGRKVKCYDQTCFHARSELNANPTELLNFMIDAHAKVKVLLATLRLRESKRV